jgi:hypothetical protein
VGVSGEGVQHDRGPQRLGEAAALATRLSALRSSLATRPLATVFPVHRERRARAAGSAREGPSTSAGPAKGSATVKRRWSKGQPARRRGHPTGHLPFDHRGGGAGDLEGPSFPDHLGEDLLLDRG